MQMLPDRPADELVTITYFQSEMAAFRAEIHADFADFRSEMRNDFAEFRSEMRNDFAEFRSEVRGELAEFRGELTEFQGETRGELAEMKGHILQVENSLTLRMSDLQSTTQRWVMGLATTNVAALVTALLT